VTPSWRLNSPIITRSILSKIPFVRNYIYWSPIRDKSAMRLDRHPGFVSYLRSLERVEIAVHGLYHCRRGPHIAAEYMGAGTYSCITSVRKSLRIFSDAQLPFVRGFCPPCWTYPPQLESALVTHKFDFVASARDLVSAIDFDTVTQMSGLNGVSLIFPQMIADGRLVHITTNFQATSSDERALKILELGGLLSIKAHAIKNMGGHIMLDGLDDHYVERLAKLLSMVRERWGSSIWWTSMAQVANRIHIQKEQLACQ
jgi:Uncharacterized protein conserved in bacteria (DUF2334)